MNEHSARPPDDSIEKIEKYFSLIESGKIFTLRDPVFFRQARNEMSGALLRMLVWERPRLEETRGISWPYEVLRELFPVFSDLAKEGRDSFMRRQAQYFLAFLPFPRQWRWMLEVEEKLGDEPELRDYLSREKEEILRKLGSKPQRHFKLRHFCQILKAPQSGKEKGVLRIFSLPYLLVHSGILPRLSRRYVLYVEPPMGIVFRHLWWRYFSVLEDPCILGIHSEEDSSFLRQQPGVEALTIAHGDFMEDLPLGDSTSERQYDIVFNATFDDMPRKRHELMLDLLKHPLLKTSTALFIGRGRDENVAAFRERVEQLRLGERVTVRANLKRSIVPALLGRSKMGVHLSLYENACRGIYEFFRSNLPCVISSSMGGMNLWLFNEMTGMAVRDSELPQAIRFVLTHREAFGPRRWFLDNSGSANSTKRLNHALKSLTGKWGYEWSRDIVQLGSSGATRYVDSRDYLGLKSEFEWLLECFGSVDPGRASFSIE